MLADNNNNAQPQQPPQQPGANAPQPWLQSVLDQLVAQQATLQILTQGMAAQQQALVQSNAAMTQAIQDMNAARTTTPRFALSTAQADPGLIDYTTKRGGYLEKACKDGLDIKFDGAPESLAAFENGVVPMCQTMAWDDICKITTQSGDTLHILKKAAVLPLEDVRASAEKYITGPDRETRAAQNNKLAVDFLVSSITSDFQTKLYTEKEKFTFDVVKDPAHPDEKEEVISFALMWKVLIDRVTENCASKRREVEQAIMNASTTMIDRFHRDVPSFLDYFAAVEIQLWDLNGDTKDLLKHFTTALQKSSCDLYNAWVVSSFNTFENSDGYLPWGEKGAMIQIDYYRFHAKARDYHRYLKSNGQWTQQSQSEHIIAMQAELQDLKGGLRTTIQKPHASKPKKFPSKGNKPASNPQMKTKNKKNNKDRRRQRLIEEWRKRPPASGEPHKKMVDGHEEIWCIYHQLWQRHTSDQCKLGKEQREASNAAHKVKPISNAAHSYADATAQATALHAIADLARSD